MRDPTADIYKIMDEAGLDAINFLSGKKSMSKIVREVRAKLLTEIVAYIKKQEERNGITSN